MTESVTFAARWLLVMVFLTAAIAKAADREGSRRAFVGLGVPPAFARPLSTLLPAVELAVAVALMLEATARGGASAALGLLLLFTLVIAWALLQGRRPSCACFGQRRSTPVGIRTLARNAVLVVASVTVVWSGPGSLQHVRASLATLTAAEQALTVAVGCLTVAVMVGGWFLHQLFLQNGRILLRLDALEAQALTRDSLPVGATAPAFELQSLDGRSVGLHELLPAGRPMVMLFSDPQCGPCHSLVPDVVRWQREHADELTVALVSSGSREANARLAREHGLANVLLQEDSDVSKTYGVLVTPSAVLIDADGTVGSPVAAGVDAIRELVAVSAGRRLLQHG